MISYYELLGLIKEGKQPETIKYGCSIYKWDGKEYMGYNGDRHSTRISYNWSDKCLASAKNIKIEDNKIEKIKLDRENNIEYIENGETKHFSANKRVTYLVNKLNEVIDRLNNMEDRK